MSKNIKIISDSSCDYSKEEIAKSIVEVVPFYITLDGENYFKEHDVMSTQEFYKTLDENSDISPKSSCPSVNDYLEVYEKYYNEGYDIITLCITSKFSGSFNSANVACDMLKEKYPDAVVTVIDTCVNTVLQGLLVDEVVKMVNEKWEYSKIVEKIEEIKKTGKIFFTIKDLTYLKRGGRIGKVASVVAKVANIRPIICLEEGDIHATSISFGRKKSVIKVVEYFKKFFNSNKIDYKDYNYVVGYGYDLEEGKGLVEEITKYISSFVSDVKVKISQIGATIGVHTGPFPIGVAFIKKYDA